MFFGKIAGLKLELDFLSWYIRYSAMMWLFLPIITVIVYCWEMPKRSHTSENPDALTPTNHMHLLCKALGDLGTNCLTVCVWGQDSIGLHVGEANRGWEFMDSSSVFLVTSVRWLPFLPSPLHPSSYKSGFSYVNHHWVLKLLDLACEIKVACKEM